jgi:hypothetical protein
MRQNSTPQRRQFKPMEVLRNQDLMELWTGMLAVLPLPPDGQRCLHHPHFTAASTDEYLPP